MEKEVPSNIEKQCWICGNPFMTASDLPGKLCGVCWGKWDSFVVYFKDIPWLVFNRNPMWNDAENCGRMFCSKCGGNWFNDLKD